METTIPAEKLGLILKIGLFVFLALAGIVIFGWALYPIAGYLIAAAVGTFAAAATANAITMRVFERAGLAGIGLNWRPRSSRRNLLIGFGAGLCAALAVILTALATRMATLDYSGGGSWPSFFFLTFALLFGAVGEEMLFRGYAFQVLCSSLGQMATLLPSAVIFGLAHTSNQNVSLLGLANTVGFGIVLGYAFLRSGDLWLPIGLHYGWNWTLPLFGVNLSGFTMDVTGWKMRWYASELWSGGAYGLEGSVITCAVIVALIFYLRKAPVERQEAFLLAKSVAEA